MTQRGPRPFAASTLDEPPSALAKRLIQDGLRPKAGKLTDAQALAERLESAAQAGTTPSMRRKLLVEAATFIRQHHVGAAKQERAA